MKIIPTKNSMGWNFGSPHYFYGSFMTGFRHEWIRPWLAFLFCLFAGHTWQDRCGYQCAVCEERMD